jgi:nucleotide-binding universal stress UspA family protein
VSAAGREFVLRRIVVAVDASPNSLETLEAAAELAARTQAELEGLFVEDINLFRLARLPFARQVSRISGDRPLAEEDLEADVRALAAQARQALRAAVERVHVKGSFRVVRGSVSAELVAAAGEADLLILGWGSQPLSLRPRLGATARAAAERAAKPVLLTRARLDLSRVLVVYEEAPGAEQALAAGLSLVEAAGGELDVLAYGASEEEAARAREAGKAWLAARGAPARVRPLVGPPEEALRAALHESPTRLLVLNAAGRLLRPEAAGRFLEENERPVLLVR